MANFVNLKNKRVVNLDKVERIDIARKKIYFTLHYHGEENWMDLSFLSDEEMQQLVDMISEVVIGY